MKLKILIIDDDAADRGLLKSHIRRSGYEIDVLEAKSGAEGLELIKGQSDLDCVFLDYMMPDMDGISALKKIYNKDTDLAPFPVVMLTGQGSEAVAIDAIRYGAQDYLIKNHITTDTLYIALTKAREIFELKKSRNEAIASLEHAQRMDAVGKLTGGIAHDFNNLLTIVFGNTRLLTDMLSKDQPDHKMCLKKVLTIQNTAKRGAELVKHLMVFSRQRTLEPVTVDINKYIQNLEDLLKRSLGEHVEIKTDLTSEIYNIDIDPGQLEHAIINMGVNTRDAMPDGGDFTLKTQNVYLDQSVAATLELDAGDYVQLTVSDTGCGIPEHLLSQIFEPFFTTKDVGEGTGLGLSMVYGFVKESGGGIRLKSVKGEGTTFDLYFPRSRNNKTTNIIEHDSVSIDDRGQETILVVEDEDDIRTLTATVLRNNGYNVLEAANGNDALNIVQSTAHTIDLVFTDIAMPGGMNGVQMAARAQALKPDIKLLFTSGYANNPVGDMDLIEEYQILNKPYKIAELTKKLREVLDAEA